MSVICYYHKVDLDGKCSAAIVRRKYPDAECIGVNYPDKPDFSQHPGKQVFIVDFCFEPEDMYDLLVHHLGAVTWIDHHKSAIEKMSFSTYTDGVTSLIQAFDGKQEIGKAGCELTWEYLFPDEPTPDAVRLLGRYDVWDHSSDEVLPFQYGMRMEDWEPDKSYWQTLLNDPNVYMDYLKDGDLLLKYENQQNKVYANASVFPVEFEGHKAWAINKYFGNSKIFETLPDAQRRPLWILFGLKNGAWKYSLYAAPDSGIDVSKIAVKYGGGGHVGAAGFKSNKYLLQ